MLRPMAYGTHVELEATATYYQAPIYICRRNRLQEGYHWEVIKPLCKPENLRFPLFMRTDRHIPLQCVGYLILNFFFNGNHYDSIVSMSTGVLHETEPTIERTVIDYINLT